MYSSLLQRCGLFMNTSRACSCIVCCLASARQAASPAADKAVSQLPWNCPATARSSVGTLTYSICLSGSQDVMPCAGQLLQTLKGHGSAVTCLKFSRHTNLLLSGSFDKAAIVWQADTGVQMQRITAHAGTHVALHDPSGHLSKCCRHSLLLAKMYSVACCVSLYMHSVCSSLPAWKHSELQLLAACINHGHSAH